MRSLSPRGLLLLTLLCTPSTALAGHSQLWGADGELWSPTGRLPDFSHAGYHEGEAPLPTVPVIANVKDFGALGDGVTDDTAAFEAAIAAAAAVEGGGAILIPAGRYVLTDELLIQKSHIVLRGEGSGPTGTVLYITKSLADIKGPAPQWSWSGGFLHFTPKGAPATTTQVSAAALRGDTTVTVADASALSAGQIVDLRLTDDGSGSLGEHLHNDQASAGDCSYQVPLVLDWPARIASMAGDVVTLTQPLRTDVRPGWSPELRTYDALEEVGVEHLAIEFIEMPYAGHLKEPGYNGVFFHNGVHDGWVRDVRFKDADNGILTDVLVKGMTFRDLKFEGRKGHHGLNLASSADLLVVDFDLQNDWTHYVTLDHRSSGVVFSRGTSATSMALDHHRDSPFENLFTELTTYNFFSGGNTCAGPHAGARNTYWNLASPMIPPYIWGGMQSNVIGALSLADELSEDQQWYENVADLDPPNLHEAQLAKRLCPAQTDPCLRSAWDIDAASCSPVARPDGTACDDGSAATESDVCVAGVCVAATPSGAGGGGAGATVGAGAGAAGTASGAGGAANGDDAADGGSCGCRTAGAGGPTGGALAVALAAAGLVARRRRAAR